MARRSKLIPMMRHTGGLYWYGNYGLVRSNETGKWFARGWAKGPRGHDVAIEPLLGPFDTRREAMRAADRRGTPRYTGPNSTPTYVPPADLRKE